MNQSMRCWINGKETPCQYLARRGPMNFDQPLPEPAASVSYLVTIPAEEFIRVLSDYYDDYAQQEAADVPYEELGQFPVLDRWRELGYPSLGDLVARAPEILEALIRDWFKHDVLDRLIPGPDVGLSRFLVNSIDQVIISNGLVQIEGKAYSHPKLREAAPDPAVGIT
jgi:hypothetical protein